MSPCIQPDNSLYKLIRACRSSSPFIYEAGPYALDEWEKYDQFPVSDFVWVSFYGILWYPFLIQSWANSKHYIYMYISISSDRSSLTAISMLIVHDILEDFSDFWDIHLILTWNSGKLEIHLLPVCYIIYITSQGTLYSTKDLEWQPGSTRETETKSKLLSKHTDPCLLTSRCLGPASTWMTSSELRNWPNCYCRERDTGISQGHWGTAAELRYAGKVQVFQEKWLHSWSDICTHRCIPRSEYTVWGNIIQDIHAAAMMQWSGSGEKNGDLNMPRRLFCLRILLLNVRSVHQIQKNFQALHAYTWRSAVYKYKPAYQNAWENAGSAQSLQRRNCFYFHENTPQQSQIFANLVSCM